MEAKTKVYLVWLHDDCLMVCETFDVALKIVARTQRRYGGTWGRSGNVWYHTEQGESRLVTRLEIQMREVGGRVVIDPRTVERISEEWQARLDGVKARLSAHLHAADARLRETEARLREADRRLELALNASAFWRRAYDKALAQRDSAMVCVTCNDVITIGTMNATGVEITVRGLRCGICMGAR